MEKENIQATDQKKDILKELKKKIISGNRIVFISVTHTTQFGLRFCVVLIADKKGSIIDLTGDFIDLRLSRGNKHGNGLTMGTVTIDEMCLHISETIKTVLGISDIQVKHLQTK
jgi:hypothetical protein